LGLKERPDLTGFATLPLLLLVIRRKVSLGRMNLIWWGSGRRAQVERAVSSTKYQVYSVGIWIQLVL